MNENELSKILDRPIVFVGLMGAGKTTLGKVLAKSLNIEFLDSDAVIVERAGCSIPEIFEEFGEPYFRKLEREVILELAQGQDIKVIGTGGGAFMNDETRQAIKDNMLSIFLNAELDVLLKRVGSGEGRPLFKGQEPKAVLADLINVRYPTYKEADLSVDTKDEPLQETLNRVQQRLYSYLTAG